MFVIINYLQLVTFAIGIFIAVYVLVKKPKSSLHQALSLSAIGMAGWNLSVFLIITEVGNLDFWVQNSFAWAALLGVGFTWFVYQYPKKIRWYKSLSVLTLILGLVFFLAPFHSGFVINANVPGGFVEVDLHPVIYTLWTVFFVGNYLYAMTILIVRTVRSKGVNRKRLLHILFGFLLFLVPSQLSNLLLPYLFNDFRWNNLGPVFTIFLIAFLFNAVMRYRLLDIKWILGKSAIFSLLVGAVLWVLFSAILTLSGLANNMIVFIFAALVIVLLYRPVEKFFEWIVRKFIRRGGYDPEAAMGELLDIVRTTGEAEALSKKLLDQFSSYFNADKTAVIIFEPNSTKKQVFVSEGFDKKVARHAGGLARMVAYYGHDVLEKDELEWEYKYEPLPAEEKQKREECIERCDHVGVEVVVPFTLNDRVAGLLAFGEFKYDKGLHKRDIEFLDLARDAIAPAIENAAKYTQIKQLYEQLEELDKAKSEFIDVVSHRFRTPLSAIRWNLEAVLDVYGNKFKKETRESLEDTHDRTLFLINTLDRLFDSLAIESGKIHLNYETFDVKDALQDIIEKFKRDCQESGLTCTTDVADVEMTSDQKRLSSIVRTLLTNAVQYTGEGGEVSFEVSQDENRVIFRVSDTGIGIPEENLDQIFDKFFRAKNAKLTYTDGQGLGLYFCKEIVDLLHGEVDVDSELEKGTTFTVYIPRRPEKEARD